MIAENTCSLIIKSFCFSLDVTYFTTSTADKIFVLFIYLFTAILYPPAIELDMPVFAPGKGVFI